MKLKLSTLLATSLLTATNLFAQVSAPSLETSFQNFIQSQQGSINNGTVIPTFLIKENTKGNRYLFEKWVKGYVLGTDGAIYKSENALFNYDKTSKQLYLLLDNNKVMELSSGVIAGFNLTSGDTTYHFERLKNSTDPNFYQPIYKNEKGYSLYKLLTTKFKRADYQSNGIIESGNKYDEYIDEVQYFIVTSKQEVIKVDFKKKNLQKSLTNDSAKVESFFSEHKNDKMNEDFVKSLLQYLNS